jgi:hypothetical protein
MRLSRFEDPLSLSLDLCRDLAGSKGIRRIHYVPIWWRHPFTSEIKAVGHIHTWTYSRLSIRTVKFLVLVLIYF